MVTAMTTVDAFGFLAVVVGLPLLVIYALLALVTRGPQPPTDPWQGMRS